MEVQEQVRDARLLPVVGWITVGYVTIMVLGYFIGNMIYQIP